MSPAIIGLIILGISIVMYVTEVLPLAVTTIIVTLLMGITGVAQFSTVFSGWSSNVTFLVIGTIIIGDMLFATGAAQYVGGKLVWLIKKSERRALLILCLVTALLSGFLSNTTTAAIMLPVAASIVSVSKGKLKRKNLYMPIGMAAVTGGSLSLIGTPCNLVVSGFLGEAKLGETSFWEWAMTGVPKIVILLVFLVIFGPGLMKRFLDFQETDDVEEGSGVISETNLTPKMVISLMILAFAIIGFMTGIWNAGVVAMISAMAAYVTRCLDFKESIKRIDWSTILIVGFILGFANCLNECGAGKLLSDIFIRVAGPNVNHFLVLAIVGFLASFMGNCISSTPTTSILAPICMSIAPAIGMNPRSLAIATAVFATIAITTPTGQAPMTLTLVGGYRYKDYLKFGGLINVLSVVIMLAIFPMIYPLSL